MIKYDFLYKQQVASTIRKGYKPSKIQDSKIRFFESNYISKTFFL